MLRIEEVADYLEKTLGAQMTAYIMGLEESSLLPTWAHSNLIEEPEVAMRLKCAYQAARMLADGFDASTAQTWFFGKNGRLDGKAPAAILRHAQKTEDAQRIVPVALAFVGEHSNRVGAFVTFDDESGILAISATVSDGPDSRMVPYIVPGN